MKTHRIVKILWLVALGLFLCNAGFLNAQILVTPIYTGASDRTGSITIDGQTFTTAKQWSASGSTSGNRAEFSVAGDCEITIYATSGNFTTNSNSRTFIIYDKTNSTQLLSTNTNGTGTSGISGKITCINTGAKDIIIYATGGAAYVYAVYITVLCNNKPLPQIATPAQTHICAGASLQLNATPASGTVTSWTNKPIAAGTINANGLFTAAWTDKNTSAKIACTVDGCVSDSLTIYVDSIPDALKVTSYTACPTTSGKGKSWCSLIAGGVCEASYRWYSPINVPVVQPSNFAPNNNGLSATYWVSQTTGIAQCESPKTTISVNISNIEFPADVENYIGCEKTSGTKTWASLVKSQGTVTWYASLADAAAGTPSIPAPTTFSLTQATADTLRYWITVYNECTSSPAEIKVFINPRPTATISGDTAICSGSNSGDAVKVALSGSVPFTFNYVNGSAVQVITSDNPHIITLAPDHNTTYILASLSDANCHALQADLSGSATITLTAAPTFATGGALPDAVCSGSALVLAGKAPTVHDNGASITKAGWLLNDMVYTNEHLTYADNNKVLKYYAINACDSVAIAIGNITVNKAPELGEIPAINLCGVQNLPLSTPNITYYGASSTAQKWYIEQYIGNEDYVPFYSPYSVSSATDDGKKILFVVESACGNDTAKAVIQLGDVPTAEAGTLQDLTCVCTASTTATMTATPANAGTGVWTVVSKPAATTVNIDDAYSPTASVSGLTAGSYTLRWTVTNDRCSASDDVSFRVITDTEKPTFNLISTSAPANTTFGSCLFTVPDFSNFVLDKADNCTSTADLVYRQIPAAGSTISTGTNVIITLEDLCGNVSSAQIVEITVPPAPALTLTTLPAICLGANVDLQNAVASVLKENETITFYKKAGKTDELTSLIVVPQNAGDTVFYAVIENTVSGCYVEKAITITVLACSLEIVKQPQADSDLSSICSNMQSDITLTVEAKGNGTLHYQWFLVEAGTNRSLKKTVGIDAATHIVAFSSELSGGEFQVEVSNGYAVVQSDFVLLKENPLHVAQEWDDVIYVEDFEHQFAKFQWYKDGIALQDNACAQYYANKQGLNGRYHARCYYPDGTFVETCPTQIASSLQSAGDVSVQPNPSEQSATIRIDITDPNFDLNGAVIEIFYENGKFFNSYPVAGASTVLQAPPLSGNYLVRITPKTGKIIVKKLVVK